MIFILECHKMKRTGLFPVFLGGGILAALMPIINMAARSKNYLNLSQPPLNLLLNSNWKMMAMLNVLLIILGSCIIYHMEYSDNALQKMNTLPLKEYRLFFGKFILMAVLCILILAIEALAIAFCAIYWFRLDLGMFYTRLLKNFLYFMLLAMPVVLLSLFISSAFKNMWLSLGIGIIGVFMSIMLPANHFVLSIFPYSLPFHLLSPSANVPAFAIAAVIESIIIAMAATLYLKIRRAFE